MQSSMSKLARIAVRIVSIIGLGPAALFFFYAVGPWTEARAIPMFGSRIYDTVLFGAAGLLCIFVVLRLIQSRVWAWWITFVASILVLGLGIFSFYSALHPSDAGWESGFVLGVAVFLMTPAAVACVLLSLPSVRREFVSSESNRRRA